MGSVTVDPVIEYAFGEPPKGMNLRESLVAGHDAGTGIALGLAIAAVVLRFYVRIVRGPYLWLDDWLVVASIFSAAATVGISIIGGTYGAGEHIWATNLPNIMSMLKLAYSATYVYGLSVTSTKLSILLFYRRLFHTNAPKSLYDALYWTGFFLAISYPITLWITMANICKPVSYYWMQYVGAEGSCLDISLFLLIIGLVNMANNVIILLIPIPRILELQLNLRLKLSIIGIMMLGGFILIAGALRIYSLNELFNHKDATWWMGSSLAWSSIEPSVGIVSACLPTYAPLFRLGKSSHSTGSPYVHSRHTHGGGNGTSGRASHFNASASRGLATHFGLEDDEVELTCKVSGGPGSASVQSKEASEEEDRERGIVINTQISVTTRDRDEKAKEKLGFGIY